MEFDRIVYSESSFGFLRETLEIDLTAKSVRYVENRHLCDDVPEAFICSHELWQKVMGFVQDCNFPEWQDDYSDNLVVDGTQWELELYKGKKRCKRIYGSNDYPSEWRVFTVLKRTCSRLLQREFVVSKRPKVCPFCGSTAVKPYEYGLPGPKMIEDDSILLGGCCVTPFSPKWGCEDCEADFLPLIVEKMELRDGELQFLEFNNDEETV